jgi:hypothetical protein
VLLGGGICFFDNTEHTTIAPANDPTITGRVIKHGRDDGGGDTLVAVVVKNNPQGVGIKQWNIAAHDYDISGESLRKSSDCHLEGASRSGNLVLNNTPGFWRPVSDGGFNLFTLVTNNHNEVLGLECLSGGEDVANHGHTREGVQDFGGCRFHSGPLAGGQDYDGKRAVRHTHHLSLSRAV